MKKHLIIIITVSLFICTNIATFIFAHGRVQIVEKVVTAHKDEKEPAYAASLGKEALNNSQGIRNTGLPQMVDSGEGSCDFDDPGYPIVEDASHTSDNDKNTHVIIEADEEKRGSDEPRQYGGAFYPDHGGRNPGDPSFPPSPLPPHDDTIPIPQLPLCGADFDVATGEGSFSGIAPPPLPEIDELQ